MIVSYLYGCTCICFSQVILLELVPSLIPCPGNVLQLWVVPTEDHTHIFLVPKITRMMESFCFDVSTEHLMLSMNRVSATRFRFFVQIILASCQWLLSVVHGIFRSHEVQVSSWKSDAVKFIMMLQLARI